MTTPEMVRYVRPGHGHGATVAEIEADLLDILTETEGMVEGRQARR